MITVVPIVVTVAAVIGVYVFAMTKLAAKLDQS